MASPAVAIGSEHVAEHQVIYHLMSVALTDSPMRTTLDLDDDVLTSAKEIARREKKTTGQVLSELARRALTQQAAAAPGTRAARAPASAFGFRPFATRGAVVTNDRIQQLRE